MDSKGAQHWTAKNTIKIREFITSLLEIGSADNTNSPTFIACSELRIGAGFDQTTQTHSKDYGIIHFDSPDKELMSLCFTNANISVHDLYQYSAVCL
jgi:hypothetical protein